MLSTVSKERLYDVSGRRPKCGITSLLKNYDGRILIFRPASMADPAAVKGIEPVLIERLDSKCFALNRLQMNHIKKARFLAFSRLFRGGEEGCAQPLANHYKKTPGDSNFKKGDTGNGPGAQPGVRRGALLREQQLRPAKKLAVWMRMVNY